ncbi:hypothetical protein BGW41_002573 [Actinomortierella wolfii]|nr:hypothetical protein BGW41_002573 [Actinomortierella wolfii]
MAQPIERNQDATVYVGNLDDRCTDALVWELMAQAGPVVNVHLPKDRVTQMHQNYGFCEYATEDDADYAVKILNQVKLYGKPLRINKASSDKKNLDVGASLFIGNLSPEADEMLLRDTFSAFGTIIGHAKIARDLETGQSKGYGFVSFSTFESADAAIDAMNGQILANKPISVSYAFKKDGKGERHGSAAERLIAAQARKNLPQHQMPNRLFADVGPTGGAAAAAGSPGGFPGTGANASMVAGRPPAPGSAGGPGRGGAPGQQPPFPSQAPPRPPAVPPPGMPPYHPHHRPPPPMGPPQFHGSNAIPLGHRPPPPMPPFAGQPGSGQPPLPHAPLPPGSAPPAPPPGMFPPMPPGGAPFPPLPPGMPVGMPPMRPPGGYAPPPMPYGAPPPPMPPGYPRYPGQ